MLNTRENFKTDTQYKRWLDYYEFFSKIIEIQKTKDVFAYCQDDKQFNVLNKFYFEENENSYGYKEWHIIEGEKGYSKIVWVGFCHSEDKNGDYKHLDIEDNLKNLKKRYIFKYYANEIIL